MIRWARGATENQAIGKIGKIGKDPVDPQLTWNCIEYQEATGTKQTTTGLTIIGLSPLAFSIHITERRNACHDIDRTLSLPT